MYHLKSAAFLASCGQALRRSRAALAALLFIVAVAPAHAAVNLAQVVTFGDSLTHNDLLGLFSGRPQDLYGQDPMEAVFAQAGVEGAELSNYAVASSDSGYVNLQIEVYLFLERLDVQPAATLFSYEAGARDVQGNIGLLATYAPGQYAPADAVIDNLANNIVQGLGTLMVTHPQAQFVVWTVPDVTLTPDLWFKLTPIEIGNVRAHLQRINQWIQALELNPAVVVLDFYALSQSLVLTPPVILGQALVPPPAFGDYRDVFADEIHPTAVTNALTANAIIERANARFGDAIPLYTQEELAALAHIPLPTPVP